MDKIEHVLEQLIINALKKTKYNELNIEVVSSNREDICDYQCNCAFKVAKIYNISPMIVAEDIVRATFNIQNIRFWVESPGFICIKLSNSFILKYINKLDTVANLYPSIGNKDTIVIDYGGPNIAKPLHVGHLRSAIIGESLKRMLILSNYNVISDVHLGDWGLQMGLVLTEIIELCEKTGQSIENLITIDLLNDIYPLASKKSKEDKAYLKKARDTTFKLQNGDPKLLLLWTKIRNVSLIDIKKIYTKLHVSFNYWYGESHAQKYVPYLLRKLKSCNLLTENSGALVVDLNINNEPPTIIVKSDGSIMYSTTDLATIIQRQRDFQPKEIWYIVDNRQFLHFKQVFEIAKKANLIHGCNLEFVSFGTINGGDGKPYKTRDGGVMKLNDLIDLTTNVVKEKLQIDGRVKDEKLNETSEKIAIAAIKFGDLINYREKDYIFDPNKFTSFEGKTGAYILYTIVRINSILRRVDYNPNLDLIKNISSQYERDILMYVLKMNVLYRKAIIDKCPNIIAECTYKLATLYSAFYNNVKILSEEDEIKRNDYIILSILVMKVLDFNLYLLGIEPVEEM